MKNITKQKPNQITPRIAAVMKMVEKKDIKGKKVLDIGCGYGWFERFALESGVKDIVGTEISERDLNTARKYVKDKRAKFIVASAIKLPFRNNEFDTVVSWEVLEHIPKGTENKMFSEINRVLKKGGILYLSTPYASWRSKIFDPAWWLIGHRHYSEKELSEYVKNRGFELIDLSKRGKWWNTTLSLNMYISKWVFRRGPILESRFSKFSKKEYLKVGGFKNIYIKIKKSSNL